MPLIEHQDKWLKNHCVLHAKLKAIGFSVNSCLVSYNGNFAVTVIAGSQGKMHLYNLPVETIEYVISEFCCVKDLYQLESSCRSFQKIFNEHDVWEMKFRDIWSSFNFKLNPRISLKLHPNLVSAFNTKSRAFRALIPSVLFLPQQFDVEMTRHEGTERLGEHDAITGFNDSISELTTRVGFSGNLGGDRAVRTFRRFDREIESAMVFQLKGESVYHVVSNKSYYFEVTVENEMTSARHYQDQLDESCVAIGFASEPFPLAGKQPGWDHYSYGYHGDDGKKFHDTALGSDFSESFGVGDTIGCGFFYYDTSEKKNYREIFYTKNGKLLDTAFHIQSWQNAVLYPVVGLDSLNIVQANFGQEPFMFNGYDKVGEGKLSNLWSCADESLIIQKFQREIAIRRSQRLGELTSDYESDDGFSEDAYYDSFDEDFADYDDEMMVLYDSDGSDGDYLDNDFLVPRRR